MRLKLRWLALLGILCVTLLSFRVIAQEDEDDFFTGTVLESAKDHLKVSRVVQGKAEERVFKITATTKLEGSIKTKQRVAVRFIVDGDVYTAVLVILRPASKQKAKK